MGSGILVFFMFFVGALVLAIGFSVALCRGVRREKRDSRPNPAASS